MKSKSPTLLPVGSVAIVLFTCLVSGRAQPLPITSPASNLLNNAATLNGTVNPQGAETTVWFEWGSVFVYGNSTPHQSVGSGNNTVAKSATLTNLVAGRLYHFRCVASNSLGVVRGADQSFWSPILTLNGPNPMANGYQIAFVDPGA